jgi:hypothetical protein
VKGFYRVFIPVFEGFCLILNTNNMKIFGRASGFPLVFPVSSFFLLSILSSLISCFVISVLVHSGFVESIVPVVLRWCL